MSVFNGEPYISLAVESILAQSYFNFKFIIVDNGSTDDTLKTLEKYSNRDERISIIHNPKTLSYVEGRMLGIEEVTTDWFALMDADDIAKPSRLERQMEVIEKDTEGVLGAVGTWGEYINAKEKVLGSMRTGPTSLEEHDSLYRDNEAIILIDPSSIINRKTFWKSGGYRKEMYPPCDLDLWYRLSETGKKMLAVPEILMQYRVHAGSNSVAQTMLQRRITHFVNYNMRRRRSNLKELTLDEFNNNVWVNWSYRIPRLYRDVAMTYYKKAALSFGEGRYLAMAAYLILVAILKPSYLVNRIYSQKLKK
jgi:glycosyltransferase involved in cell wall biosynthesis